MAKETTKGKCGFCSEEFAGATMATHIKKCKDSPYSKTSMKGMKDNIFLIKADGKGCLSDYWLFLEADSSATLKNLDSFLRTIWLECCGHLSQFDIGRMNSNLCDVLSNGIVFSHEYDFGTPTYLKLKVVSSRSGDMKKKVNLISRNSLPEFKCGCGKTASDICSQCIWERKALFCSGCMSKHKCGEEMALPIVNSPRAGMCWYTG